MFSCTTIDSAISSARREANECESDQHIVAIGDRFQVVDEFDLTEWQESRVVETVHFDDPV
ncbi:hypothetical protein [Aurantiacibacter poecillastricola]|uniref:hypothetical protein n=1 Tax=Aurantiacibacter poecillastricola TaxID=3064385 RepID=UPI0027402135|nr:hypothetical protein [Aurantiacibacter sp. 219JJ12-13]MDP5263358.1 hypothetical protein [Aurantiacibacter sp. 219JJ12-13]